MKRVAVTGSFDDLHPHDFRFLEEAARFGEVHALLWSDEAAKSLEGKASRFSVEERRYLLEAVRHVGAVTVVGGRTERDAIPSTSGPPPEVWVVGEEGDTAAKREWCRSRGIEYRVLSREELRRFPDPLRGLPEPLGRPKRSERKRILVTGCYDWFHSGHVRFLEEVAELGEVYVGVGSDENIRLLKGSGHPMLPARERAYIVQSIRHVAQAFIPTGSGWLDAEPEMLELEPDCYAVNEDGDRPEKRRFCEQHGIGYVVLRRLPKEGLPRRDSTALRGF